MQSARRGRRVVERRRHVGAQRVPIGAADDGIRLRRVPRIGRRRVDASVRVTGHSSPRVDQRSVSGGGGSNSMLPSGTATGAPMRRTASPAATTAGGLVASIVFTMAWLIGRE